MCFEIPTCSRQLFSNMVHRNFAIIMRREKSTIGNAFCCSFVREFLVGERSTLLLLWPCRKEPCRLLKASLFCIHFIFFHHCFIWRQLKQSSALYSGAHTATNYGAVCFILAQLDFIFYFNFFVRNFGGSFRNVWYDIHTAK